jgi:hypothetical protein
MKGRPVISSHERKRCVAMTEDRAWEAAHRCRYQVEEIHEADDPPLCNKCIAKAQRRAITLVDGRTYRAGIGVTPEDTG